MGAPPRGDKGPGLQHELPHRSAFKTATLPRPLAQPATYFSGPLPGDVLHPLLQNLHQQRLRGARHPVLIARLVGEIAPGQRPVASAGQFGIGPEKAAVVQEVEMQDIGQIIKRPPPRRFELFAVDGGPVAPTAFNGVQLGRGHFAVVQFERGQPRDPSLGFGKIPQAPLVHIGPVHHLGQGDVNLVPAHFRFEQLDQGLAGVIYAPLVCAGQHQSVAPLGRNEIGLGLGMQVLKPGKGRAGRLRDANVNGKAPPIRLGSSLFNEQRFQLGGSLLLNRPGLVS